MNTQHRSVSKTEVDFIKNGLLDAGVRVDGRQLLESRSLYISLVNGNTSSVQLGRTRVLANISCDVVEPRVDRPTQGFFAFDCNVSPMAGAQFSASGYGAESVEIAVVVERCLKESRAVDPDSLCILAGVKVWRVNVVIHVIDADGNLLDAASVATVAALRHFCLPAVSVDTGGRRVTIHGPDERNPTPLTVHHSPVCCTFGLVADAGDQKLVCDPTAQEEHVLGGLVTVALNQHNELCLLHKCGGMPVDAQVIVLCVQMARAKCSAMIAAVDAALRKAIDKRGGDTGKLHSLIAYLEAPIAANGDPGGIFGRVMDESDEDAAAVADTGDQQQQKQLAQSHTTEFVWDQGAEEQQAEAVVAVQSLPAAELSASPGSKQDGIEDMDIGDDLAAAVVVKKKRKKKRKKKKAG